jgi:hypothetical protein
LLFRDVEYQTADPAPKERLNEGLVNILAVFNRVVIQRGDNQIDVPGTQLVPEDCRHAHGMFDERRTFIARLARVRGFSEPKRPRDPFGVGWRNRSLDQRETGGDV